MVVKEKFTVGQVVKVEKKPSLYERQYEFCYGYTPRRIKELVIFAVLGGKGYAMGDADTELSLYTGPTVFTADGKVNYEGNWLQHPKRVRVMAKEWYSQKYKKHWRNRWGEDE